MAGHASSGDIEIDWLRLASDRNVSHDVARALWEEARATSPDDPLQAEQTFHLMLDDAEAANITHEPGRETLAGRGVNPRDAASLGPGKWTRVLLEQAAPAQGRPVERKPTAASIQSELASAGQAGKQIVEMLAASDPATIVEALRGLSQSQTGIVGKLLSMATGAVERALERSANWDIKVTPAPAKPTTPVDPETGEPLETGPVAEAERVAPAAPPAPPPDDKPDEPDDKPDEPQPNPDDPAPRSH